MNNSAFAAALVDGHVVPQALADLLDTNRTELAATLGLPPEALSASSQLQTAPVQSRLRELGDILNQILPLAGSLVAAYTWYRSQILPSFGDATAEQLVRDGRADDVRHFLDRLADGGFA